MAQQNERKFPRFEPTQAHSQPLAGIPQDSSNQRERSLSGTQLSDRLINGLRRLQTTNLALPLVPLNGNKQPLGDEWQNRPFTAASLIEAIQNGGVEVPIKGEIKKIQLQGFGILTGRPITIDGKTYSLMALDQDGKSAIGKILSLSGGKPLPKTVAFFSGRLGRCQYLFSVPEEYFDAIRTKKVKTGVKGDDGKPEQVEFRWANLQSVLPPSAHPTTGQYHWVSGCAIDETEIALAPDWVIEQMLIDPRQRDSETGRLGDGGNFFNPLTPSQQQWTDIDFANSYLKALGSYRADDYDDWLTVGMALHSVSDSLLAEWDSWSQQSAKYQPGECEKKWKSFSANGGISLGTLGHMAIQDGWQSPFKEKGSCNNGRRHTPQPTKISIREAVRKARQILTANPSALEQSILLEELRSQTDLSSWDWENRYIKPLKKELQAIQLKLDVAAYLKETDPFELVRLKGQICSTYRISGSDLKLLADKLEQQQRTPLDRVFTFDEFFNQGTEALRWIVPGLLPVGETVLLAALAKTGKTLLATEIVHAVLSGSSAIGEQVGVKGKVLLITSDESPNSTRRRLRARGFDLLGERQNLRVMTHLDISDLSPLEQQLEDFRPALVVIDSLTSITEELGVSEKDAEFAKYIYRLKDLLGRYGAAGILIHHENKDKEAKGLNKISGSARIPAAVWGIWQMVAANPNNEKDSTRWLKVKPREGESVTLTLSINPKDLWASSGIFELLGELGDESGEKKTQGERVLSLLKKYSPKGLEYREIDRLLNIGRSLYTVLDRLEDRQMIAKRRSEVDRRRWVYTVPIETNSQEVPVTKVNDSSQHPLNTPPPSPLSGDGKKNDQMVDTTGIEDIQQKVNNYSTVSQHPLSAREMLNDSISDTVKDSEVIQPSQLHPGERGGVVSSDPVEQNGDRCASCSETAFIENEPRIYEWDEIKASIDREMARLGWTPSFGRDYLKAHYGKRSRMLLSNEELLEFWNQLKSLPSGTNFGG